MNYADHYSRLIDRARGRVLDGYRERHHVVPRCMGGGNEATNLVDLTGEEHYVAHQLLVKIYPGNYKLVHAATLMAKRASGNKAYGWLCRLNAKITSVLMCGKILSPETKAKIGKAHKGNKHALGCVRSPETRAKMGAGNKGKQTALGRVLSAETKKKIGDKNRLNPSRSMLGRTHTAEARERIAAGQRALRGTKGPLPQEIKNKISRALTGRPGRLCSQEHRAKISTGNKGKMRSQDFKDRLSAAMTGRKWTQKEIAMRVATRVANNAFRKRDDSTLMSRS